MLSSIVKIYSISSVWRSSKQIFKSKSNNSTLS